MAHLHLTSHRGRVRIEALTPEAREWLHRFAWVNLDDRVVVIEIDADAVGEYTEAARAAGFELD